MSRYTIVRCDSCSKEQKVGEPDSPPTIFTLLQLVDSMGETGYFCDKACLLKYLETYKSPYNPDGEGIPVPPDAMPKGLN